MSLILLLVACAEGPKPAATSASAPAVKPASAVAAVPTVEVGPDGPTEIAIVALADIPSDPASVGEGQKVFDAKGCGGCHAWGSKLVGPDLTGLSTRRTIPWIQRMVQDPDTMTKKDPVARELFKSHMIQMPKQGVTDAEMPMLLAFVNSKGK